MTPSLVLHDFGDMCLTDSELPCECVLTDTAIGVQQANFLHLLSRQFSLMVAFARQTALLLNHVAGVIAFRADKDMSRIDTAPIVTAMKGAQPIGNWPDKKCVRNHMTSPHLALEPEHSVTIRREYSCPVPAAVRRVFVNQLPEVVKTSMRYEMVWIDTMSVSASVLQPFPVSKRPATALIVYLIRQCAWVLGIIKTSISIFINVTQPQPATRFSINRVINNRNSLTVSSEIQRWLTFHAAVSGTRMVGNRGLLTTPAMAISVRNV